MNKTKMIQKGNTFFLIRFALLKMVCVCECERDRAMEFVKVIIHVYLKRQPRWHEDRAQSYPHTESDIYDRDQ